MLSQLKKQFKKVLKIDAMSNVTPFRNLVSVGFMNGFYMIPQNFLNASSICYCIGAGIDISFDTELVVMYDSNVFIFDPMPEGKNHYSEVVDAVNKNKELVVGANEIKPFVYRINKEQLEKVKFIELGIWDKEETVKFYEPTKDNYASHSIVNIQKSEHFIEAKVDRLSHIMKRLNHTTLDLVKIEIEGAEYKVIETILEDKLDVKVLLVEYDEAHNMKGINHLFRIKESTDKLINAGYKLVHSTEYYKRTFIRKDVLDSLNRK